MIHTKNNLVDPIVIGKIGTAYGIYGWLKVFSFTEDNNNIFNYQPWFIKYKDNWKLIKIKYWKQYKNHFIVRINEIRNRTLAMELINYDIFFDSSQFPTLKKGEYYWKDILKCKVITIYGYCLGDVIDLIETASNDVLVVKSYKKDLFRIKKRLIPFIDDKVVKTVDLVDHMIYVDWNPSIVS